MCLFAIGSASRSLFGGFVRWEKGEKEDGTDSIAVQIADENVLLDSFIAFIYKYMYCIYINSLMIPYIQYELAQRAYFIPWSMRNFKFAYTLNSHIFLSTLASPVLAGDPSSDPGGE